MEPTGPASGGHPASSGHAVSGLAVVGVGIDIVEVARVAEAMRRRGDRFLRRFFTPGEIAYCSESRQPATRFAARLAAKEAILKALGTGLRAVRWTDIDIVPDALGKPTAALSGGVARLAARRGATEVHVSLSHGRDHAIAHALAIGAPPEGSRPSVGSPPAGGCARP